MLPALTFRYRTYILSRKWTEELIDSITYLLPDNFLFQVNVPWKSIIL